MDGRLRAGARRDEGAGALKTLDVEQPSGEHDALARLPVTSSPSKQSGEPAEVVTWRSISIVLTAYNEEPVIAGTVQDCVRAAERFCPNVEVIVVDDGSRDRTGAIIDELAAADQRVVTIHHAPNQGYGAALLTGFAAARGELLFFMDSDGQFDIEDIATLLRVLEQNPEAMVLGYRERRRDSWLRRANAWGWKQAVRLILGLKGVRDVDCAFKLFPTRVVQASGVTARGALVNAELLAKLQRMHIPMVQAPVRHYPRAHGSATGANPRVILKAFRELLRLRLQMWRARAGDPSVSQVESVPGQTGASTSENAVANARIPTGVASVLKRLPVPSPVRRIGPWLVRHASPEWRVAGLASALSIGFYVWYARQGLLFAYGDAVSHMLIARRVLDGRTPGLAQLGSVWPPLNHILMLPLIWNDTLWRDGFAGAFPSMVAYVVSVVYMFRLGKWCFSSGTAGFVAALAFMVNPSVLYMQSTAMSELDLLCAAILGIYYLLQWASAFHARDLVKAAGAIAAGTLVRYDGWALAGGAVLIVAYVAWRRQGRVAGEAQTILFSTLALAGCVAWLIYNWVIFSDPLYSFTGPYSARSQEQRIAATSGLPTQHNVWLSLQEYGQAVIGTVGWPIAIVALLGLIGFVWRLRFRPGILPAYGMLVPFAFNWASLFLGISILLAPEIKIHGVGSYFNVRYGMMMIPAVALFVASWSTWRREVLVGILGLIVVFSGLNPALGTPYALRGPLHDAGRIADMDEGKWLASHYQGGTVLMSEGPFSPMTFYSNLPDRAFLTEANGAEFRTAVAHPETSVTWIVMDPDSVNYDAVWAALGNRQDWRHYFVLVDVNGTTQIYQRIWGNWP